MASEAVALRSTLATCCDKVREMEHVKHHSGTPLSPGDRAWLKIIEKIVVKAKSADVVRSRLAELLGVTMREVDSDELDRQGPRSRSTTALGCEEAQRASWA